MTLLTTIDVTTTLGTGTTVQVTDIETGRSIVRQWFLQRHNIWSAVSEQIADHYGCQPEDVSLDDIDDGAEFVTVRGEIVARYVS
jgi:hypothetical protein